MATATATETPIKAKCTICDESYNKSSRVPVQCLFCEFDACRKCCETYLLTVPDPKCMNATCNKTWTRKFLVKNMTHAFLSKPYREYKERCFFDKEQSLMPATQIVIEEQIRIEGLKVQQTVLDKEIARLYREKSDITRLIFARTTGSNPDGRKQFIRRCGDGGVCRGFLSTQWKCGLCEQTTCNLCHVVKKKGLEGQDVHVCDPGDVETAKLLSHDSKPCPCCATLIFKIDGCDQMFCTQCNTGFSWTRGTIQTEIHNPHYFEWMRRNGNQVRQPGDVQCGRDLGYRMCSMADPSFDADIANRLDKIVRTSVHLREIDMPRFIVNNMMDNESLRIRYMRQQMDEATFKVQLHREQKKYEKKQEIHGILNLYITSITDILYRSMDVFRTYQEAKGIRTRTRSATHGEEQQLKAVSVEQMHQVIDEIVPLLAYINECLEDVSNTFHCVKLQLNYNPRKHEVLLLTAPKKSAASVNEVVNATRV